MKYNLSKIMRDAWRIFRKGPVSFSTALRMAWANIKTYNAAKEAAGVTETTHTWSGWQALGFEVIHESKALFKANYLDPTTKKGTRIHCFFGESQVQLINA
ncbi:MAG: hypothetical protein IJX93_06930 [Clostridia bacterium]|nr:hypothetical protein [Clostridia bacterium]